MSQTDQPRPKPLLGTHEIKVASLPDREDLVAEIWYGNEQWAEVTFDEKAHRFLIQVWAPQQGSSYVFDLAAVAAALERAQRRLQDMGYGTQTG